MIILLQLQKIELSDIYTFIGCMVLLTILVSLIGVLEHKLKDEDENDYSIHDY
jgi:hypothetical protein